MKNSRITKKEVKRMLDLAKLKSGKDEMERLTEDLNDIIEEMEKIRSLSQEFYLSNVIFQQVNNQFALATKKFKYSTDIIKDNFPVTSSSNPVVPPIKGED